MLSAFKNKGFSSEVANLVTKVYRLFSVSKQVYIWTRFQTGVALVSTRDVTDPWYEEPWYKVCLSLCKLCISNVVCDYLLVLKGLKLQFAIILLHNTAICAIIHMVSGVDLSQNHVFQTLLKGFKKALSRKTNPTLYWNLQLVLETLKRHPLNH